MSVLVPVLIVVLLVLLNGLFVAAEFAIVGAPRASIERLAESGSRTARLVHRILEDPREQDRFIATAQLGITLASLGLGMYGEHLFAAWIAGQLEQFDIAWLTRWVAAHTLASFVAITVLTYVHIVVGEMVPKSLALQRAQTTVLWIAPVVRVAQAILYPLVLTLNGIGTSLLRMAGVNRADAAHEHARTPAELAFLVRESQAGGLLRRESARVIQELIDFAELTAGEVMVPRTRIRGLPLGATRDRIREVLMQHPHTRYPVYTSDIDHVIGVVHVKDLIRLLPESEQLERMHVRTIPFVPTTVTVEQVLATLRQAGAEMVIVLDEFGGTAGLVTAEDLFEEVVGEFGEDALEVPPLSIDGTGRVHLRGTVRLDELAAAMGMELEHEDVDSTGGLVMALLGREPHAGDVVHYRGVRLEVRSVEGHGVGELVVTRAAGTGEIG